MEANNDLEDLISRSLQQMRELQGDGVSTRLIAELLERLFKERESNAYLRGQVETCSCARRSV